MINLCGSLTEFDMAVNDTVVLWAHLEYVSLLSLKNRIQVCLNHVHVRLNQGLLYNTNCWILVFTSLGQSRRNHFSIFPIFVDISIK